jgi:hypothetical protein
VVLVDFDLPLHGRLNTKLTREVRVTGDTAYDTTLGDPIPPGLEMPQIFGVYGALFDAVQGYSVLPALNTVTQRIFWTHAGIVFGPGVVDMSSYSGTLLFTGRGTTP